jgi:transmembrane sensor
MPVASEHSKSSKSLQEAINWLIKLRDENLSDADSHAFADWLTKDVAHADAFAKAEKLFDNMVLAAQLPYSARPNSPKQQTGENLQVTKPIRRQSRPWLALPLALAAVWLFIVTLVLPRQSHLFAGYFSDYYTKTGEIRDIQLPDGSHILLNTDSAVSIDYQTKIRQVTLHHGQARFTVAKDTLRAFEVKVDQLNVRALGTEFDIYKKSADDIRITVQEHAVSAWLQADNHVQIHEGQRLIYQTAGVMQLPRNMDLNQSVAWQQRRLFINDRPLSELINELSRYRVGRIFLANDQLKNLHVTGVFSLDKPDEVLARVRKILNLQETRLGPWWVLLHH